MSGGIDSALLAALLQESNLAFRSMVIGSEKSKDIQVAHLAADNLGLSLETLEFDTQILETMFPAHQHYATVFNHNKRFCR